MEFKMLPLVLSPLLKVNACQKQSLKKLVSEEKFASCVSSSNICVCALVLPRIMATC